MQTESVRYLGTGVAIYLGTVDANGTALALALTCAAQDGSRASRLRDAMVLRRGGENQGALFSCVDRPTADRRASKPSHEHVCVYY